MTRKIGLAGVSATVLLLLTACGGGGDDAPPETAAAPAPTPPVTPPAAPPTDVTAGVTPTPDATVPATDTAAVPAAGAAGGTVKLAGLTGNATAGQKVFAQCRTCHVLEAGVNKVGPSLAGIVGRPAGTIPGFRYSPANKASGAVWTNETLFAYLENPRKYIPGTYMSFVGLKQPQQRADVIAYLNTAS